MTLEIIRPTRQHVWGWPAILNFALGGTGGGLFLVTLVLIAWNEPLFDWRDSHVLLIAPGLVATGLLAVAVEAGRPLRSRFLLANLSRSWMSRETVAALVFLPLSIAACLVGHPALWLLGGAGALAFVISQGFVLHQARAVPAWNRPLVPVLFLTSALSAGAGLFNILHAEAGRPLDRHAMIVTSICLLSDALLWLGYVGSRGDSTCRTATAALRHPIQIGLHVGLFRLAPALLASALLLADATTLSDDQWVVWIELGGWIVVAGGLWRTAALIRVGGSLRSVGVPTPSLSAARGPWPVREDRHEWSERAGS